MRWSSTNCFITPRSKSFEGVWNTGQECVRKCATFWNRWLENPTPALECGENRTSLQPNISSSWTRSRQSQICSVFGHCCCIVGLFVPTTSLVPPECTVQFAALHDVTACLFRCCWVVLGSAMPHVPEWVHIGPRGQTHCLLLSPPISFSCAPPWG